MCTWANRSWFPGKWTHKSRKFTGPLGTLFSLVAEGQVLYCFLFNGKDTRIKNSQLSCCGWHSRFSRGHWSFVLPGWGWGLGTLACTSPHILSLTWTTEGCPWGSSHVSKITDIFTYKTAAETHLTSTLSNCHPESLIQNGITLESLKEFPDEWMPRQFMAFHHVSFQLSFLCTLWGFCHSPLEL